MVVQTFRYYAGAPQRLLVDSNTSVRVGAPFGGFKQSGYGRELGPDAVAHYTELKNVFYATEEAD